MADNFRVLDVRVDELAANLNALYDEPWVIVSQDYYFDDGLRMVTVLLMRMRPQVAVGTPIDPRILRQK